MVMKVPPLLLSEVVGLAQAPTYRKGVFRAPFSLDGQVQFVWLPAGIRVLLHQFPRILQAQAMKKDLVVVPADFLIADASETPARVSGRIPFKMTKNLQSQLPINFRKSPIAAVLSMFSCAADVIVVSIFEDDGTGSNRTLFVWLLNLNA